MFTTSQAASLKKHTTALNCRNNTHNHITLSFYLTKQGKSAHRALADRHTRRYVILRRSAISALSDNGFICIQVASAQCNEHRGADVLGTITSVNIYQLTPRTNCCRLCRAACVNGGCWQSKGLCDEFSPANRYRGGHCLVRSTLMTM